jgi:starch-binding outer membrane protein, SusD/RagB family
MKMKSNYTNWKNLFLATLLIITTNSCNDLLDVQPKAQVDANGVLSTPDAIQAAINSVYARLRNQANYGRDLLALSDAMSDIGSAASSNSGRLLPENRNQSLSSFTTTTWQNSYFAINEININLQAIADLKFTPAPTTATINGWIGQLKFLRALYYHDLMRVYAYDPGNIISTQDRGGVPLTITPITTSTDASAAKLPRASITEVYTQIYADLNDAIAKLPASSGGPFTATQGAANALLSRVALYNRDYTTVANTATAAIASPVASLLSGAAYVSGWRANRHPESLFEVKFQDANENIGVNTSLQTSYTTLLSAAVLGTAPAGIANAGFGDFVPTAAFRTNLGITGPVASATTIGQVCTGIDVRTQLYAVGPGRGSGPKIECIKFLGKNAIANLDNVPVIRESEMFLNRAEAYATPGSPVFDEAKASTDLNAIRVARGLASVALTGAALQAEIQNQRLLEFAFEGHRWFDLKRRGVDVIKSPENILNSDFRRLSNIPQREVDGNPNLKQNFGY